MGSRLKIIHLKGAVLRVAVAEARRVRKNRSDSLAIVALTCHWGEPGSPGSHETKPSLPSHPQRRVFEHPVCAVPEGRDADARVERQAGSHWDAGDVPDGSGPGGR